LSKGKEEDTDSEEHLSSIFEDIEEFVDDTDTQKSHTRTKEVKETERREKSPVIIMSTFTKAMI
jgi:hypothetical protein